MPLVDFLKEILIWSFSLMDPQDNDTASTRPCDPLLENRMKIM